MMTLYRSVNDKIIIENFGTSNDIPADAIWLDIMAPSENEKKWFHTFNQTPSHDLNNLHELELATRCHHDEHGIHIHSFFPYRHKEDMRLKSILFQLKSHLLVTVREDEIQLFQLVAYQLKLTPHPAQSAIDIFLNLLAAKIDYLADIMAGIYSTLEKLNQEILTNPSQTHDHHNLLKIITQQQDLNDKIRLCLFDTQRALRYLIRHSIQSKKNYHDHIVSMLRDVDSLSPHTQFLFAKMNFLLDALMGFISHEQNNVNKIFTFIATLFLPPTLVGSIYGMNFKDIPELDWEYGYLFALILMILSALLPYIYFKYKKWL